MPFTSAATLGIWGQLPSTAANPGLPVLTLPRGFDAVAQFSSALLQESLQGALADAGLVTMSVQIPLDAAWLPVSIAAAVPPRPVGAFGGQPIAFELRLSEARLVTLGRTPAGLDSGVSTGPTAGTMIRIAPPFGSANKGQPAEIDWLLELNLLSTPLSLPTENTQATARSFSSNLSAGTTEAQSALGTQFAKFERKLIAGGQASLKVPVDLQTNAGLLQAYLQFETASSALAVSSQDAGLQALLQSDQGQSFLKSLIAPFTTCSALRASPVVCLAGDLSAGFLASLQLGAFHALYALQPRPQGGELLSIGFGFGEDVVLSASGLQPFAGTDDFAFYVTRKVIEPALKARWLIDSAGRQFTGTTQLPMPVHEGSSQTGTGTIKVQVDLGEGLTGADLLAYPYPTGDLLLLKCDQTVHVLAAWYADGSAVGDLGELGQQQTLPFQVNVAPYSGPASGQPADTPFRDFLLTVLEPLAVPLVQHFPIATLGGFLSEALGASVCRWSLPNYSNQSGEVAPTANVGSAI